jgi:hypothetical protein
MSFLTSISSSIPNSGSLIHIVNPNDTTQNPSGSSYKTPLRQVEVLFLTGSTNNGILFNSGNAFKSNINFTFNYQSQSLQQGLAVTANGLYSHAEGNSTIAIGDYSHAEGVSNITGYRTYNINGSTDSSGSIDVLLDQTPYFSAGASILILSNDFTIIGSYNLNSITYDTGSELTNFIINTYTNGDVGYLVSTDNSYGIYSHAEGFQTVAIGSGSHAEGLDTQASGSYSHAEGQYAVAIGPNSHAEGYSTQAIGFYSHTEGLASIALAEGSHAEGVNTQAIAKFSHAEGLGTQAIGHHSHAEGAYTQAIGSGSHAEGHGTIASGFYQHVQGQFNISSSVSGSFIIGNGISSGSRSNLVFTSGSIFQVTGSLHINDILILQPRITTPTGIEGMIISSGSAGNSKPYYYNGSTWNALF